MNKDKSLVVATELPFEMSDPGEFYAGHSLKLWKLDDPEDLIPHYCVTSYVPEDEIGPEEVAVIPARANGEPLYIGMAASISEDTSDHAKALIDYGFTVASAIAA